MSVSDSYSKVTGALLAHLPGSTFISGYSVGIALGMIACGATEGSPLQTELLALFGKKSIPDLQTHLKEVQGSLHKGQGEGLEFLQGNSIWARGAVLESYIAMFKDVFANGTAAPLTTKEPINEFIETATKGLIKDMLTEDPKEEDLAILVNTAYFKGSWAAAFDVKHTNDSPFRGANKETNVPMMFKSFEPTDKVTLGMQLPLGDVKADLLSLPYKGERFHGVFVMPSDPKDYDGLVEELKGGAGWSTLREASHAHMKVEAFIPRFKLDSGLLDILAPVIEKVGITSLCARGTLANVCDDPRLAVAQLLHRAVVDVNEEGTEAAAATVIGMRMMCMPMQFRVDRPFLFAIYDTETKFPVFAGKVADL